MATQRIQYTDKEAVDPKPNLPVNWVDDNANEIKNVVNNNADEIDGLQTTVNSIYDGIANASAIQALNPSAYLGQVWWAKDEKSEYHAVTSAQAGGDIWQRIKLDYNAQTDSFKLSATQDGQIQNIGQEIFIPCYNDNGTGATELNPKVFLVVGAKAGEEEVKTTLKPIAADVADGSEYGINTTDASVGNYYKLVRLGTVGNVNTSSWSAGTFLYVDPNINGELTDVKPQVNAFAIGRVLISSPTVGIIDVNTVRSVSEDPIVISGSSDPIVFTGEQTVDPPDPAGTNTFYKALRSNKGTVPSATENIICPDNTKVGITKNHIGTQQITSGNFDAGAYEAKIEFSVSISQANERLHLEVYLANADGTVVDSGSGLPIGGLGVPPIAVGASPLYNTSTNTNAIADILAIVPVQVNYTAGQRIVYHILAEKVGSQGGNKTFTIYFGSDHFTFLIAPKSLVLSDLSNVEITTPQTDDFLQLDSDGIWRNHQVLVKVQDGMALSDPTSDLVVGATDGKHTTEVYNATDFIYGVAVAPLGQDIILDTLKNGSTIWLTKPRILAGTTLSTGGVLLTTPTVFNSGDYESHLIDQIGTTTAGAGLKVYNKGTLI